MFGRAKGITIGNRRKNGTIRHDDWDKRDLHKKCWKELQLQKDFIYYSQFM